MSLGLLDSCWNFLGVVFDGLMVCDMILQLFRPDSQQHRFEYGIMNAEVGSGKELVHKLDASCMICIICIVCLFDNKTNMQTCKLIKVGCFKLFVCISHLQSDGAGFIVISMSQRCKEVRF